MMKDRVCLMLIAALMFSVFAALPIQVYAPIDHTDTYKSDTTDLWWSGANSGHIDGSNYIVPPGDASWTAASLCWVHPSWNSLLNPADRKAALFAAPSAQWIWGPVVPPANKVTLASSYTGEIVFFKEEVNIPADAYDISASMLIMTADNAYYFYVNDGWSGTPDGKAGFVGTYGPTNFYYTSDGVNNLGGGRNSVPYETGGNLYPKDAAIDTSSGAWSSIEQWNIASSLHIGTNWLQIVAINEHADPYLPENNPAGLIYKVTVTYKTPIYYYLTVQTDPSGLTPAPTPASALYAEGTVVTETAYDVTGYIFLYWDLDGVAQTMGVKTITITMNSAHTVTAHYWPELGFETFMTDSSFCPIDSFDTVWTPKDMRRTTFKLASTNPGQFMWNIVVENTWPDIVDTLTINYNIDPDFELKGADPIQVHTGYGKTGTRIDATVTYGQTGTITLTDIASGAKLYITLHLEYGPARDYFSLAEMNAWKTDHEPNNFIADYTATSDGLTATGTSTTTLPDPLIILAIEEL